MNKTLTTLMTGALVAGLLTGTTALANHHKGEAKDGKHAEKDGCKHKKKDGCNGKDGCKQKDGEKPAAE